MLERGSLERARNHGTSRRCIGANQVRLTNRQRCMIRRAPITPRIKALLTGLGVAWVAPCFGSLLHSSHPMGFHAAINTMTPQLADKRMAVLSHLAVWWCSSRCVPLGCFGCANERCRSKTNVRRIRSGTQEQTPKPLEHTRQPPCLWLVSHFAQQ